MTTKRSVALITGGTRGIGLGCAQQLALAGFDLALNGVRAAKQVNQSLNQLAELGAETIYCRGDIAVPAERRSILQAVRDHFGRLNVLVNNAGIAPRQRLDLLDTTETSFDEVIGINLKGPFFLSQSAARWLIEQKQADPAFQGCMINISSISATVASSNRGEYCISKAGMSMVSKLFADRLGPYDIPVIEVRPGIIQTDMTTAVQAKYDALIAAGLCIARRWGTPDDIGRAVATIATGNLPYATGQTIVIDGGLTVARL